MAPRTARAVAWTLHRVLTRPDDNPHLLAQRPLQRWQCLGRLRASRQARGGPVARGSQRGRRRRGLAAACPCLTVCPSRRVIAASHAIRRMGACWRQVGVPTPKAARPFAYEAAPGRGECLGCASGRMRWRLRSTRRKCRTDRACPQAAHCSHRVEQHFPCSSGKEFAFMPRTYPRPGSGVYSTALWDKVLRTSDWPHENRGGCRR